MMSFRHLSPGRPPFRPVLGALSLAVLVLACQPPRTALKPVASVSPSPSPKAEPAPAGVIRNQDSELVCAVQVATQAPVAGNVEIENICETIVSPDQIRYSSPEVEKLVALAHTLLTENLCAKSLELYQQAYALETEVVARGYLSHRIVQVRQCTAGSLQFRSGAQLSQVRQVQKERAQDYKAFELPPKQAGLLDAAQSALVDGQCQASAYLYGQIIAWAAPDSALYRFASLQQTFVDHCQPLDESQPNSPSATPPLSPSPSAATDLLPDPVLPLPSPLLQPSLPPSTSPSASSSPAPGSTPTASSQATPSPSPTPEPELPSPEPSQADVVNSLGMRFRHIQPGSFTMGQSGIAAAEPAHQVTLTQGYYLQTTEVTQEQWLEVMGQFPGASTGLVPNATYGLGDEYPMYYVSWHDIHSFLGVLNGLGEGHYRLPSEAEWEYAARAGTLGAFSCEDQSGNCPLDYAWTFSSSTASPYIKEVGSLLPNPWGLYDMHGNVTEWLADWYGAYSSESVTDPQGPASGTTRVHRGGSWSSTANNARSASRVGENPNGRHPSRGFRLIHVP